MTEEGQNVTITCSANGQPEPSITWSRAIGNLPNTVVVKKHALAILNVKKQDRGIYICKAKNVLGAAERQVQMTVFPRMRFFIRPPKALTPIIGSLVHLPCVPQSVLKTKVTWLKDGKLSLPVDTNILRNNTLVIPAVKNSHVGLYTCRASNALTTIEARVEVKTPVFHSCSVIRKYGSSSSGSYVIDPDGEGGLATFSVYCDMSDKNGIGVTVVSHNSESRTLVDGYDSAGSYSKNIHYSGASFSQLASLTKVSSHCEQFIKYECYHSLIIRNNNGWWESRKSTRMSYWGGAAPGSRKCACGMTNSCVDSSQVCNCDKNDAVWREDSGLLTDKSQLPVKALRFGDTGTYYSVDEKGYYTLGEFKCYGIEGA